MVIKKINSLKGNSLLEIGLMTSTAILAVKLLNTLLVYHFFTFDKYLAIVASVFLLAGYFLSSKKQTIVFYSEPVFIETSLAEQNECLAELKAIRYSLTIREFSIFKYLAEGNTNKEIASTLSIHVSTVKTHVNNLFTKIKCKNRKEAIEIWDKMIRNQLIL